eukprot:CAMPEP_0181032564 /NCGR_PEP_ID=MMETSP1070-20121207/6806_1 /TAXON_ID=265543 /ORGANISM="Minutocellus polymorphus, Strain NH13" /LENGTH=244 /DNA_ID=CAMNT_0023109963 /DNA_START=332 /DNA_END=1068 /DNA_ORIENTATION=-
MTNLLSHLLILLLLPLDLAHQASPLPFLCHPGVHAAVSAEQDAGANRGCICKAMGTGGSTNPATAAARAAASFPAGHARRRAVPLRFAFLFPSSVPKRHKSFASQLLSLSEQALRADPTVCAELGMGVEAGGVYASAYASASVSESGQATHTRSQRGGAVEQLVLQFQIAGGNAWAQGVAFGVREEGASVEAEANKNDDAGGDAAADDDDDGRVRLVSLEVANMDAVLNGVSFEVPIYIPIAAQ